MIFDENDDLRGCTVRLRHMEPGESITIPMDAERIERCTCVEYIRGRICAFQETSEGAYPSGQDIMEVLQRPLCEPDLIHEVHCTAKAALKALLDDAEAREYGPPVPTAAVADLEWIIHATSSEGTT